MAYRANVDVTRATDGASPLFIATQSGFSGLVSVRVLSGFRYTDTILVGFSLSTVSCLVIFPVLRILLLLELSVVLFVGKMLLAFRANVDVARTTDGSTPLIAATLNGDTEIVAVRIWKQYNSDTKVPFLGSRTLLFSISYCFQCCE